MVCNILGVDGIWVSKDRRWVCPLIRGHLLKPVKKDHGNRHAECPQLPSDFYPCLLSLSFTFYILFYYFTSLPCPTSFLSLWALTNISLGLQTQFSNHHSDVLGIAPMIPLTGGTKTGKICQLQIPVQSPSCCLCLSLQGMSPMGHRCSLRCRSLTKS